MMRLNEAVLTIPPSYTTANFDGLDQVTLTIQAGSNSSRRTPRILPIRRRERRSCCGPRLTWSCSISRPRARAARRLP
jgi:hypothetical protein